MTDDNKTISERLVEYLTGSANASELSNDTIDAIIWWLDEQRQRELNYDNL